MRLFKFKKKRTHDSNEIDIKRLINKDTPFAVREAYRSLCTNVLYLPIEDKCKKIVMTSAISGEGKTSTSINFALTLSEHSAEQRILLIDCDMRKSRASQIFPGINIEATGLTEYLLGLDKTPNIQKIDGTKLSVLTAGGESLNPAGLLNSTKMRELMRELEEDYDYIIIDTPPVNVVSDALVLKELINGYIITVRADYSDINELSDSIEAINAAGGEIFGIVLGAVNFKSQRKYKKYYSKYSKYGYSYGYGYGEHKSDENNID